MAGKKKTRWKNREKGEIIFSPSSSAWARRAEDARQMGRGA
jgi:hypothetical protein